MNITHVQLLAFCSLLFPVFLSALCIYFFNYLKFFFKFFNLMSGLKTFFDHLPISKKHLNKFPPMYVI